MDIKKLKIKGIVPIIIAAIVVAVVFVGYKVMTLSKPKGIKLRVPELSTAGPKKMQQKIAADQVLLNNIKPASFSFAFGLDYNKMPKQIKLPASVKPKVEKKVAFETPKVAPKLMDLSKKGYRLKGIILEDGKSAVFIYDPHSRKVVVVRESSEGEIKLLDAGMRSVKILTKDGEGVLHLETAKGIPGMNSPATGFFHSGGGSSKSFKSSKPVSHVKPQKRLTEFEKAAPINYHLKEGNIRISGRGGNLGIELKKIPENLKSFKLQPRDKIIGIEDQNFRSPNKMVESLNERDSKISVLKVKRGRKIIYLPREESAKK